MTFRWIVGYDFSPDADAAIALAAEDLVLRGGELHLLHAYNVPQVPLSYEWASSDAIFANPQDFEAALKADVGRSLEKVIENLKIRWPELKAFAHLRAGLPAQAILAQSAELGVERIVVGSAGRTGLAHLFLGSVAERVVRQAEVPVIVVKAAVDQREAAKKEAQ
jgi:universal stress protein A